VVGQVAQGDHDDAGHHHQQGRRDAGGDPLEGKQQGQAAQPDGGRPAVDVAEPGEQVPQLGEEVALALGDAQQRRHLADDDRQSQAEHEPGLHRRRDEPRHEPHVQHAQHHQDDPDEDGQGGRQLVEAGRVAQATGATSAAEMAAVAEVGLTTSCRELPARA
jgi:hypothetical protein